MATRKYSNKRKRRVNRFDTGGITPFNALNFGDYGLTPQGNTWTPQSDIQSIMASGDQNAINQLKMDIAGDHTSGVSGTSGGLSNLAKGVMNGAGALLGQTGYKVISGGLNSGAGNAIMGFGSAAGDVISTVDPVIGGAVKLGSGLVGGITNALFGSKLNQERINNIEGGINQLNQLQVDDSSTGSILNQFGDTSFGQSFSMKDIGSDGLFSSKAKNTYKRLKREQATAINRALGNFSNAADNVQENQILDSMANYVAYGGPITMRYTGPMSPFGNTFAEGGGIHIKKSRKGTFTAAAKKHGKSVQAFASQVLANKDNYSPAMVKKANFARNFGGRKRADGGWLDNIHGGIFDNGVITIGNGGTHEQNPYEGIQMGVDEQGIPNLVEEGEVIFNDYVYSNRIKAPKEVKKKYKLRGETFADLAENAQKESEERPFDPISQRGLQDIMAKLAMEQESIREKSANRSRKYAHGGKLGNWYDGWGDESNLMKLSSKLNPLGLKIYDFHSPIFRKYFGGGTEFEKSIEINNIYDLRDRNYPDASVSVDSKGRYYLDFSKSRPEYNATVTPSSGRVSKLKTTTRAAVQRPVVGDYSYGTNMLNLDRNINTADLYKQGSNYMKARQYVLDNWDSPYVQNWLNNYYIPFVTKYNRSRGYKGSFNVNRDQFEKGTYDGSFGGMHQGLINFQYPNGVNTTRGFDAAEYLRPKPEEGPIWRRGLDNPTAAELGDIANEITGFNSASGSAIPSIKTTETTTPKDNKANPLTYLRYAPILGNAIGLTQSLLSKPDYSNADAVLEASRDAGRYMPVGYKPIGNYLTYTPFDRDYYTNKLAAQAGATRRAITGQSAGNRATAMAGLLAADYNVQNNLGNLARQAAEYNFANRQAVETFNRGTNMFNSEQALKAAMANQDAYARSAASRLQGTAQAMAMRQAIDDARNAGIAANFSNIFQTLGDIGNEEVAHSWIEKHPALYYGVGLHGEGIDYKGKSNKSSYGGYITRKNKKKGGKR